MGGWGGGRGCSGGTCCAASIAIPTVPLALGLPGRVVVVVGVCSRDRVGAGVLLGSGGGGVRGGVGSRGVVVVVVCGSCGGGGVVVCGSCGGSIQCKSASSGSSCALALALALLALALGCAAL